MTMNFGNYDGTAEVLVDGSVKAVCTSGTNYTIALDGGNHGGTPAVRKLGSGTHTLNYTLLQADNTTNWGNVAGQLVSGVGDGTPTGTTYAVHGHIASGQAIYTGSYTDTITATITF